MSEPYWQVGLKPHPPGGAVDGAAAVDVSDALPTTQPLDVTWERGRIFDRGVVTCCLHLVRDAGFAGLLSLTSTTEKKSRPLGLNTVTMLKVCSKALGMGAQKAMHVAESLYMAGYLSYPRTESSAYPKGFDFNTLVRAQVPDPEWGEHAAWLLEGSGRMDTRSRGGGVDAGDHPPITPMQYASRDQLAACGGTDAIRLFAMVARTFLASLCPDAIIAVQKAVFDAGGEHFTVSGRHLVEEGWLRVMPHLSPSVAPLPEWLASSTDGSEPPLSMRLEFADLRLLEGHTSPPGPLSESDLITLMERTIGTDASIPSHIGTIESRRYARLVASGGRAFEPTPLGIALIEGIGRIDEELVSPLVRSHVEKQLDLIAKGSARRGHVVGHILNEFEQKFRHLQSRFMYSMSCLLRALAGVVEVAVEAVRMATAAAVAARRKGVVVLLL